MSAEFPEDSPECFDILLGWIYDGYLRPLTWSNDRKIELSWKVEDFYAFAEKICLPELMDATMDAQIAFSKQSETLPSLSRARKSYGKTSPSSAYRKFLAHVCAYRLMEPAHDGRVDIEDLSALMLEIPALQLDILQIIRDSDGKIKSPSRMPLCDFHTHDKDLPCPRRKGRK
jgi:hypothetical protein